MEHQEQEHLQLVQRLSADLHRRVTELEAIFDLMPIGIALAEDPECRRIRVNRVCAEQLGIDPAQNASLTAPASERPSFRIEQNGREVAAEDLPMQYAARHGVEVKNLELDVVHPDGRRVTLYEYASPLFDEQGRVRGAVGAFVDISERRRVEQEQRLLAEASGLLSSSLDYEKTLATLTDLAVPVFGEYCAIDVVRPDGSFARVNLVVADPARAELGEALRAYPPAVDLDSPAAGVIRTGQPLLCAQVTPDMLERSAQSPRHLELMREFAVRTFMMVPIRARGRTLGLMTVGCFDPRRRYSSHDLDLATDIAARAGLALDNALLYRDAQEANRLKEDFLATLSHELRTPLNALLGWAHMLKSGSLDEDGRRRAIESIERNARAQTVLINDLLDVSRVISGKLLLDERPVELTGVLLAAVDAVRPAVRAREIELALSLQPVEGQVLGDADRLQQVVWNLLTNAVKFTPIRGRVELRLQQTGGAVQITVTDNGSGIEPAFLPHVFERFRQADSSSTRAHGGLGLGLSIVKHLVNLHGGTVTAHSDGRDKGATFVVTLPAVSRPLEPVQRTSGGPGTSADTLKGMRVLVVDDDADARELLMLRLQKAGADVLTVGSVPLALDALRTYQATAIIADIAMPDMDGYELLRELARRGPIPPAIAISAYLTPADDRRVREAGFALQMEKPVDYDRLVAALAELSRHAAGA